MLINSYLIFIKNRKKKNEKYNVYRKDKLTSNYITIDVTLEDFRYEPIHLIYNFK
jgi:hypothetical protein